MKPATVCNNPLKRSLRLNKNLAHYPGHRYSKLMLVDSMAHLTDPRIQDFSKVLDRARDAGVTHIIHAGVDPHDDPVLPTRVSNQPQVLKAYGIHPMAVGRRPLNLQLQQLENRLQEEGVVALGEMGLDKRSGMPAINLQMEALEEQLKIAHKMQLPVILHCVKAAGMLLEVIESCDPLKFGGVWHGYTGSPELVSQIEKSGLHLSIGAVVTYEKSKKCRLAAVQISPERLLVESDSPDHPPRGWRNELSDPSAIKAIIQELGDLRKEPVDFIKEQTALNAQRLFGLKEST